MNKPVALITGASRGLGFAMAETLSDAYHIVAVARTVGGLEDLDDRIKARGNEATLAPMDVALPEAMAQLCRSIHDRWGGAALWVHTAAHSAPLTPAHHIDAKDWGKSVATNVTAMGHLVPYIAALLGEKGRAVFFDDPQAGQKFYGSYGATKAAQIALTRSWQAETATFGPKVDIVQPAPMGTALRARFHPGQDKDALATPRDEADRIIADLGLMAE
ncbi:SDR family NAD(P)-dependent oxidoreductase [Pseudoprimorskyibacter insulae]|uniref:3-oxoacyl-[acyl-carrier-protein] reductase FabG n=1 Tax=Pseudoprimorskyibacter insulae TaxID=1695997 RepID=A0A2R8AXB6_9RHOB|nr:SDR family NAD(P)-dependent oxidoreductase [Pseudoprimorskyibacter insulae]SPF80514.1 3-oxoacyl-[acyl-carrier-protein] reductase FabG [Pseudoprimorskyibacter insulae]